MKTEKEIKPMSGYPILLLALVATLGGIYFITQKSFFIGIGVALLLVMFVLLIGLFFINPNKAMVLTMFGDYKGTVKENGFYWVNPF